MKKITKIIAFLLVFVMLASMLASCGDEKDPAGPGSDTGKKEDPQGSEQKILPDLPDKKFDGSEFIIRCMGESSSGVWTTVGMDAEEKTGDPINDATLERNNTLEKTWGVTISTIEGPGVTSSVTNAVLNQLDEFDIALTTVDAIGPLAPKYVYDLKQVKYIDLAKPWYDQNFNAEVSIGGRLYAVTGDAPISDDNGTWSVLFNKRMAEDYEMPNLYKLVFDGKWTLDKLYELAATVTKDDTGDDILDENDIWGFQTESYNAYAIVASSGEKIASKDADDMPYLTANSEKFARVFAKAVEICGDKNVTFLETDYTDKYGSGIWTDCYIPTFTSGRVLFKMVGLAGLTVARNMEDEVGVMPMPKYEESQEYSLSPITVSNATCIVIPASVIDIEKTAILTEAFFAESRYTTRIAYYETTLKKKYSADDESKKILDEIIEHRTYDLGSIYGWGGIIAKLQSMLGTRSSNFSSAYKSLERVAQNAMNKTIKAFETAQNVQ